MQASTATGHLECPAMGSSACGWVRLALALLAFPACAAPGAVDGLTEAEDLQVRACVLAVDAIVDAHALPLGGRPVWLVAEHPSVTRLMGVLHPAPLDPAQSVITDVLPAEFDDAGRRIFWRSVEMLREGQRPSARVVSAVHARRASSPGDDPVAGRAALPVWDVGTGLGLVMIEAPELGEAGTWFFVLLTRDEGRVRLFREPIIVSPVYD